ncbi:zinc finger CCHC domain-containing protein 17 isoform X3 [Petaurus breviceps papuanus]
MSSCRVDKPSEIVDVGDKVWVKLIGREMKDDKVKLSLSMKVVNQGTGKDLDPNNIITDQEERRKRSFKDYTGQKITLEAVLNTTCKKCGCRGLPERLSCQPEQEGVGQVHLLLFPPFPQGILPRTVSCNREAPNIAWYLRRRRRRKRRKQVQQSLREGNLHKEKLLPGRERRRRKRKRNTGAGRHPRPAALTLTAAKVRQPARSRDTRQRAARGRKKSTGKRAGSEGQTCLLHQCAGSRLWQVCPGAPASRAAPST